MLDVLASRVTTGVITGEVYVNGNLRDASFQRQVGYVQQQDIHLETTTVREALQFSAFLRQPDSVPKEEKVKYVEEIIALLEMQPYADAIVGVPGEGLNVEQRKRLTIGVELAAKPDLLLFLDEPTSGLDSQTAWAITGLLRKLSDHGQAILCTIHQPSAILFQQFDRLLLLAKGGKTVYFGDIGKSSETLINYFERHGAEPCGSDENPAEWMLGVMGAAPGSVAIRDWPETWRSSEEFAQVRQEVDRLKANKAPTANDTGLQRQYAMPFRMQLWFCTKRVFEQYWRSPSYIYAKLILCFGTVSPIKSSHENSSHSLQLTENRLYSSASHFCRSKSRFLVFSTRCLQSLCSWSFLLFWLIKQCRTSSCSVHYTNRVNGHPRYTHGPHSCYPTSSSKYPGTPLLQFLFSCLSTI